MLIGWLTMICASDGFGNVYGEKFGPAGSRTATPTTMSEPAGTFSFSPIVAQPATLIAVLLIAPFEAISATTPSVLPTQATKPRRSMI